MSQNKMFLKRYGQWAIVTGATNGIGREFAIQLAELGFNMVLVARRRYLLEELAHQLTQQHRIECMILDIDLSQTTATSEIVSQIQELDLGLLVASAGFGSAGNTIQGNINQELKMIDVNCRSLFELSHACGKRFSIQKRGGIILMSSLLAFQGAAGSANYAATKAYVQTLAEGMYHELKLVGVDVLAVAPGPVETGFAEQANMQFAFALQPRTVVREAISALGRKMTVRPGLMTKFLEFSLSMLLFRYLRVLVMGRVMTGMIKH
jgi:uncharacterized protein